MLQKDSRDNHPVYTPCFVKRRAEMTGNFLKDARVNFHQLGQSVVDISFDDKGAKKFAVITSDYAPGGAKNPDPNRKCQLAIVLDDTLYSAPS